VYVCVCLSVCLLMTLERINSQDSSRTSGDVLGTKIGGRGLYECKHVITDLLHAATNVCLSVGSSEESGVKRGC